MVVKIQRSQFPRGQILVYSKDRSRWWQGIADTAVDKWLGKRQKAYANAHIEGAEFIIDGEAPWQQW